MKIQDLKIGQILKEGNNKCEVVAIHDDKFEVQYISGACWTYSQSDLDDQGINSTRRVTKKKLIEIPAELFDKIARLASENDRSVNKEINHLLKSAVHKKIAS
jgi:hypothetical protein